MTIDSVGQSDLLEGCNKRAFRFNPKLPVQAHGQSFTLLCEVVPFLGGSLSQIVSDTLFCPPVPRTCACLKIVESLKRPGMCGMGRWPGGLECGGMGSAAIPGRGHSRHQSLRARVESK